MVSRLLHYESISGLHGSCPPPHLPTKKAPGTTTLPGALLNSQILNSYGCIAPNSTSHAKNDFAAKLSTMYVLSPYR